MTNNTEYLRDLTGGRRFWPIKCELEGQIDNDRLRGNIMQIWAETVTLYQRMIQQSPDGRLALYISDEAASDEAARMQESRRVETPEESLAGEIGAWLDTPEGAEFDDDAEPILRRETCIAQIWKEMWGKDGSTA